MSRAAQIVRGRVPRKARRLIANRRVRLRMATGSGRPMPSFMIIGTQRGGTSSLYKYLQGHPDLAASIRKETEYFSRRFGEGESWYRAHFARSWGPRRRRLAFEATPDYLFYPPTPKRVAARLPDERFVVLLRDPVERAYSQYRHMVRLGFEDLSFPEALVRESERIASDLATLDADPAYYCRALLRFSYAARGRYARQLERWFGLFDPSRFLILRSEDLFADPAGTLRSVVEFLGVRPWTPTAFRNHSYSASRPAAVGVSPDAAEILRDALMPDVERLESLLGRRLGWSLGRSA